MQSLYSFLSSIQLQSYHEAFIKAGASDQDLSLLIQLSENELVEFINALNMLPFHAIKFKKAIRDFNTSIVPISSTKDFIAANSIIYGKNRNRTLTAYEEAINRASFELALNNPLLISRKGHLFDLAKKKLLQDGYEYKRGSSRSKLKDPSSSISKPALTKRPRTARKPSQYIKIQQLEKCASSIDDEVSKLKEQERKHQWYEKRKQLLSISSLSNKPKELITSSPSSPSSCSSVEEDLLPYPTVHYYYPKENTFYSLS